MGKVKKVKKPKKKVKKIKPKEATKPRHHNDCGVVTLKDLACLKKRAKEVQSKANHARRTAYIVQRRAAVLSTDAMNQRPADWAAEQQKTVAGFMQSEADRARNKAKKKKKVKKVAKMKMKKAMKKEKKKERKKAKKLKKKAVKKTEKKARKASAKAEGKKLKKKRI